MRYLKTNTAVIITVGPFYDKADGVTIETALTITNERITLTADTDDGSAPTNILDNVTGATSGTSNDLNYITGNDAGMMQLELSAANVNRLGRMFLSITDAANHVPVFHEFMVLPAVVYDSMILGTDLFQVDATQWLGTAIATPDTAGYPKATIKDGTGAGEIALTSGVIDSVTTVTTTATTTTLTNDPTGVTTLLSRVGTPSNLGSGATVAANLVDIEGQTDDIGTAGAGLTAINLPDQTMNITGNITGNLSGSVGSVTAIVDASIGQVQGSTYLAGRLAMWLEFMEVGEVLGSTSSTIDLEFYGGADDTLIGCFVAVYNGTNSQARLITDYALTNKRATVTPDWTVTPTGYNYIIIPAGAAYLTAAGLQSDAVAEIQSGLSTLDAAGVRTAVGLASANLDTQLDALPTNAELTTALAAADDAVLAAITALNNLSAAQVNAEVVDALATDTYAEPTGVPGATVALSAKIGYLYMALRNAVTVTATKKQFYDDGGAAEWEKDLSDDGTTYTESEGNAP